MTDVFFKGFGSWYAWKAEGASVIVSSYEATGVFSLNVSDEITYNHTGNLPLKACMLHPTDHPDSEFSRLENLGKTLKMAGLGDLGGKYTANNCFFVMDEEQQRDKILVIASPYQAIPEAEAVGNDILSMQPAHLKNWINKGLDKHLTHFEIAELWATPERNPNDVKNFEALISQAVEDGDLLAEVSISNPKAIGGFETIPYSPTTLRQANNGFLNGGFLQFTIHRDKFQEWLIKSNQWPIADGCLLNQWLVGQQSGNESNLSASSLIRDWYHRIGHMTEGISQTIGTEPMSINWAHWLSLSLWSKNEAVLLISGLNPNKFHEIERHENYQSICEPFIELCQRTIEEAGTPYYWLDKFNKDGYLDCVPKGARNWLTQQIEIAHSKNQAETVASVGVDSDAANKPEKKNNDVKKLIPQERETTELLNLIYQMLNDSNIQVGDELRKLNAVAAWGQIISGKYKNDYINKVEGTRKTASIVLNGGEEVDSITFKRTYNRRFK